MFFGGGEGERGLAIQRARVSGGFFLGSVRLVG